MKRDSNLKQKTSPQNVVKHPFFSTGSRPLRILPARRLTRFDTLTFLQFYSYCFAVNSVSWSFLWTCLALPPTRMAGGGGLKQGSADILCDSVITAAEIYFFSLLLKSND